MLGCASRLAAGWETAPLACQRQPTTAGMGIAGPRYGCPGHTSDEQLNGIVQQVLHTFRGGVFLMSSGYVPLLQYERSKSVKSACPLAFSNMFSGFRSLQRAVAVPQLSFREACTSEQLSSNSPPRGGHTLICCRTRAMNRA